MILQKRKEEQTKFGLALFLVVILVVILMDLEMHYADVIIAILSSLFMLKAVFVII